MSLYKRFRGHEPSPEALLKRGTTINHDTIFYFRTEAAMLRFFYQKKTTISHQKIGMLSTQKEV
jgi:hypothetical protein